MKFIIFCDGACLGNPGRGGWASIISDPAGETVELGGVEEQTTNNRMEMQAVLSALEFIRSKKFNASEVIVHSDSKYFIDGISKWVFGWLKNGWKNGGGEDVKNQDLWKKILETKRSDGFLSANFKWVHVEGHAGVPGNERCDEIATGLAAGELVELYAGPTKSYPIDLSVVSVRPKRGKPYYLSVVDGVIHRDQDWPSCQARVQGRRGVKYKKVYSSAEEADVLKQWGVPG